MSDQRTILILPDPNVPPGPWSPFGKNGKLRITTNTDPWWKRLLCRLRGEAIWHQVGTLSDGER